MENKRNFISKLLRKKEEYFDEILSSGGYWKQIVLSALLSIALLFVYGALSISNFGWEQSLLSGLKLIILFFSAIALCFPTFYIFSAFKGSELEIKELVGMFMGFLANISLILIALVPVNWLFAFSDSSSDFLGFLFFLFNAIALFTSASFLRNGVKYLNEKLEGKVGTGFLLVWMVVFVLVLLQMSANLGPWFSENRRIFREEKVNFLDAPLEEPIVEEHSYGCDVYHSNCY